MDLAKAIDALTAVFDFIAKNTVAGAFALLWLRAEISNWLERDERKSAQKELETISKDTAAAFHNSSEVNKETAQVFEKLWDGIVNLTRPNGKGR